MTRMRKAGCVLLVLLWMLPLFSVAAEGMPAAEDPIIVRVGEVTYTRSQIQPALQSDINLAQLTAGTYLRCGLDASLAANKLIVHRNTFNYRLNAFIARTGLDIRDYHNALLLELYFDLGGERA